MRMTAREHMGAALRSIRRERKADLLRERRENQRESMASITSGEEVKAVRHVVKPRSVVRPADFRPKQVCIRLTERTSAQLASIQGLIASYGDGETLAKLFEKIVLPALERFVEPYAEAARADRERAALDNGKAVRHA